MIPGGGAWTSGTTDLNQFFTVNLGYRQVITGVATQGRRGSNEFVIEYYLWFSSDNLTWTVYTNQYGTPLASHYFSILLLEC
jgi:contactin associated protein-like 2